MVLKKTTYQVMAKGRYDAGLDISATSLEDAVAQAKTLTSTDFINFVDSHNDSTIEIYGVFENS